MEPTWRKPAGILGLIAYLAVYAGGVSMLWPWLGRLPVLVQALAYLLFGVAWLLPLGPLLQWMATGQWRRR